MAKKKKFKLWKYCIILGILLGIGIKVYDFTRVKAFRCGIQNIRSCSWTGFLKEIPIWMLIFAIVFLIIAYCTKFLIKYIIKIFKEFEIPDLEEEEKPKKKSTKKKAEKKSKKEKQGEQEEVIKI